jgi:hypothetical protein
MHRAKVAERGLIVKGFGDLKRFLMVNGLGNPVNVIVLFRYHGSEHILKG